MEPILTTDKLTIGYRDGRKVVEVASNISIGLRRGEVTCLLGSNGRGKSTLLRTLAGSQPALRGRVLIDGDDLAAMPKRRLARLLSIVSTDPTLAGALTVEELVALGRQPHTGFLGRLQQSDRDVVTKAMQLAGVAAKRDSYVANLSDGERQKTMIARAIAQDTPVILLDEPTAFLDVASKLETMRLLGDIARREDKAVLLSSHDVSLALLYCDSVITLDCHGEAVQGAATDDATRRRVAALFGSEASEYINLIISATQK